MSRQKVTVAQVDDWQGLYVEGKLLDENHSLNWPDILKDMFEILDIEVDFNIVNEEDHPEWGENLDKFAGRFPENEKDLY